MSTLVFYREQLRGFGRGVEGFGGMPDSGCLGGYENFGYKYSPRKKNYFMDSTVLSLALSQSLEAVLIIRNMRVC